MKKPIDRRQSISHSGRVWHSVSQHAIYLVARNKDRLAAIAMDLKVRGATSVSSETLDVNDFSLHEPMLDRAERALGGIDTIIIAHGTLSDQPTCERSVDVALNELTTNALSTVALATRIAARLAQKHQGTLVVISSVAGDRGRQSNFAYGCAKALVSTFMSGLRQRMHKCGVAVITVKPGFVDTPMTAAFRKGLLWTTPEIVARGIVNAIDRKKDVVYLPFFWRPLMFAVRLIPERVFKRLTL